MKYVMLNEAVTEGVTRIHHMVFPEYMTHALVALGYAAAFKHETGKLLTVRSAGFCEPDRDGFHVTAHGSESLGIKDSIGQSADDDFYLQRPEAFNGLVY